MSPRFVDMNADGYDDIVVGGHDGFAQIVYGNSDGFKEAEQILDRDGDLITLSKYYDWEKQEGKKTGWRYKEDGPKTHGTSVNVVDWDADGDFDLLIGDSAKGGLFVRMNEGSADSAEFVTENVAVVVDDEPVQIRPNVSDSLIVDWNKDGLFDIILGGVGGGIYLLENTGAAKNPAFSAVKTLVKPVDERAVKAARSSRKRLANVKTSNNLPAEPGGAIYLEATDYDSDGKLDLLVGARCSWKLDKIPGLTEAEQEEETNLNSKFAKLTLDLNEAYAEIKKTEDKNARETLSKKTQELNVKMIKTDRKLRDLQRKKKPQRHGDFIWLLRGK